ncbi:MAG: hypothetical protein EXQ94_02950 [Alphaproteobacteria bacterium]|nr:hypothetical protein [Alphaproteobacteria bacterium]
MIVFRSSSTIAALVLVGFVHAASAQTSEPVNILPEVSGTGATADQSTTSGGVVVESTADFEVVEAGAIGAEASGTLGDAAGGLGVAMWRGTDRAVVEALLPRLAPIPGSPTLLDLARRLLLTQAEPPSGVATRDLLALRLDRLQALGLPAEGLGAGPAEGAVASALARARFGDALARGATAAACAEPEMALRARPDLAWQMALIYCQLATGNPEGARLGLAVLTESGASLPPSFATLVEAVADGSPVAVESFAAATLVDIALARLAGVALPFAVVESRDPLALRLLAGPETQPEDVRLGAAEVAATFGAIAAEELAVAYQSVVFEATELREAGNSDVHIPRERALLYQAARAEGDPERRASLITTAQGAAREGGGPAFAGATARLFVPMVGGMLPTADLAWFAPTALRLALAADDPGRALAWWRLAAERANADPTAPEVALMWPLARLAGLAGPGEGDRARILAWWEAAEATREVASRNAQADLLAALLAALGETGGPLLAARLRAEAPLDPAEPPSAGLLIGLADAAAAGRVGETVLFALVALADAGPGSSAIAVAAAVHGLRRIGLGTEARRLALEGALAHGL